MEQPPQPERRALRARGGDHQMRGSPHIGAPLASHPPDSTPLRRPGLGASMDSTARKRSYNMRELRLGGELPAEQKDDSPREPKRTRPSPEAHAANSSVRSKLSKRLSLEAGAGNGTLRSKVSRRLAKSPRATPRAESQSRFVEGSMRDRESQRPPQEFLDDAAEANLMSTREPPIITDNRRSGVFRFGRAIANAFTPSFIWQGAFGREKSASPTKEDFDDRKAKAEKAYAELKRAGMRGTRRESVGSSNRDSGIDVDYRTSDERKREGHVYGPSEDHKRDGLVFETALSTPMVAVSRSDTSQPLTPETDAPSDPSRGNTRRSSFHALNRMKSHFSLKGIRRENMSPPRASSAADSTNGSYRVGKKISKKEIARQHKLTKRISNLESQLERARRELQNTLQQPDNGQTTPTTDTMDVVCSLARDAAREESPQTHDEMTDAAEEMVSPVMSPPDFGLPPPQGSPRRRRFVPGALPSLPSERLLLPPQRELPTTPTENAPSSETSPEKLSRVIAGTVNMELSSSPMKGRSTMPAEDTTVATAKEDGLPAESTAATRKRKPSSQIPRKPVPDSASEHQRVKPSTRSSSLAALSDAEKVFSAESAEVSARSDVSLDTDVADASTLAAAQDIVPGISTSDLRTLYQASAHAKRLRAIGPASPAGRRRVSGTSMSVGGRGAIVPEQHRSISPRSRRVRAAAKKQAAPVTATPGTGDRRGEIVPPLPKKKGVTTTATDAASAVSSAASSGKENKERRNRGQGPEWEGWGDDVF